ncbi:hypothetical protein C8F01DRAFT_1302535 [Mycena amicta]|nr:hypothetical protein C8F01DRAFT_1302535 [Mycena amicta]
MLRFACTLPSNEQRKQLDEHLRANRFALPPSAALHEFPPSSRPLFPTYPGWKRRLGWERQQRIRHRMRLRSLSAPIRRLPLEVLCTIFDLSGPYDAAGPRSGPYYVEWHPDAQDRLAQGHLLRLAAVCHFWRDVVFATPWLWSSIDVDLRDVHWEPPDVLDLLRASLERSRGCPLTVYFHASRRDAYLTPQAPLALLLEHSERFHSAQIVCNGWTFPNLSQLRNRIPNLVYLSLRQLVSGVQVDFLQNAPRLRRLAVEFEDEIAIPTLPWSQITQLSIHPRLYPSASQLDSVFGWLSKCHAHTAVTMHNLNISDLNDYELPETAPDPPNFPSHFTSRIHTFDLAIREDDDEFMPHVTARTMRQLLAALTLHDLTSFALSTVFPETPLFWSPDEWSLLAERSGWRTSLRRLHLGTMVLSPSELIDCLGGLPALEDLLIEDVLAWARNIRRDRDDFSSGYQDHILLTDELLARLTDSALVPHLHTFTCASFMAFTPAVFRAFVSSRMRIRRLNFRVLCAEDAHSQFSRYSHRQLVTKGPQVETVQNELGELLRDLIDSGRLRLNLKFGEEEAIHM